MKKFIAFIFCGITFACIANAETINIDWIVDDETYQQTTCNIGDDLILPAAPTKYGYTFQGWLAYTPIEYIESTGTQYIDTGITDVVNSEFEIVFQLTKLSTTDGCIVGADANNGWKTIVGYNSSFFYTQCGGNGQYVSCNGSVDLEKHTMKVVNTTNTQTFICDNIAQTQTYTIPVDQTYSLYIGARHKPNGARLFSDQRTYSFYVKKNDTLVRDFIPVLDPNGVPCMYDRVTDTFFYNSGTGDFIAGPVIGE